MKDYVYLNCRERYEDMKDYRSNIYNFNSSCEINVWKS